MFSQSCNFIRKNWSWLSYLVIFSIGFIVFLWILVPPSLLCPDGFYHTKIALMMKENGIIQDFPWTQFTTYKDLFEREPFLRVHGAAEQNRAVVMGNAKNNAKGRYKEAIND